VPDFHGLHVGDRIPPLVLPPVARRTLALYAGASGDDNPIHIDLDFARAAGAGDVFAHGMLSMAYLGRLLTNWVPQSRLRSFRARFTAITHVGDVLTCTGVIAEKIEQGTEKLVRLELAVRSASGDVKATGQATVVLS
jgi:acyl dehydratase